MKYALKILQLGLLLTLFGCKKTNKNSYAIRDFNKELQPYLIQVVSKNIVGNDSATRFVEHNATDEELKKLSCSEHPVLRAIAFRTMLDRNTFNHFDLIMNHLDDTAIVAIDAGEWGISYLRISDDILQHGRWKDTIARNKTIEEVILKHNYLHSAYTKLLNIEPNEKYYSLIKEMAQRKRNYNEDVGEMGFDEIEYALYALAKFKKKEDIPLIKQLLLKNDWRMTELSFRLMKEYPDEAYLDIYEAFYKLRFYHKICWDHDINITVDFINSVATYKNQRSASILSAILNKKPFIRCPADSSYIKDELVQAIWNNKCDAYSKMAKQIENLIRRYEENNTTPLQVEEIKLPADSSKEPITWWFN